ncbi:DUF3298 and DUF4163 domain-containing protein [Ascidiimonas sp. W6]|uniref:DUF3298 and DUF4163 domain-containing protein n=1 Tax=Ascidiimonas meishanensis TaxID=3128903 RepID=UPI0030EB8B6C
MKNWSLYFIVTVFIIGCSKDEKITFNTFEITAKECSSCAMVSLNIPKAFPVSDISNQINTAIDGMLIELLSFSEKEDPENLEAAINDFKNSFQTLKNEFGESPDWEFTADGEVTYQTSDLICVEIAAYIFTGGAHGYNSNSFLLFEAKTGQLIGIEDIFKDLDAFKKIAEKKFRVQEGIPETAVINSTGFMFENEVFELAENIGFQEGEIVLIYNQYEIASYAHGQIIVEIPIDEVKPLMKIQ